jgi:predicted nucleic acid-binding protein
MFISAMTIAEIQAGVERTRERDTQKAAEIEAWMLGMIETSQVLAMGLDVARIWAKIMRGKSKSLAEDAWIAATAKSHNLVVATRNVHDFGGFGVDVSSIPSQTFGDPVALLSHHGPGQFAHPGHLVPRAPAP